jgi:hypothetical protein
MRSAIILGLVVSKNWHNPITHQTFLFKSMRTNVYNSPDRFDVALMRLDRVARLAPNVGRVCLPHPNAPTLTPPDTQATVVGWGRLGSQESDPHSNVLQAVTVPVLGDEQCQYETGLPLYSDQVLFSLQRINLYLV